jgi:hypothetical protein
MFRVHYDTLVSHSRQTLSGVTSVSASWLDLDLNVQVT